jgi:hypothetical protein
VADLRPRNFSGSCIVTSRNSLIHKGATTATNSKRFDPKRCTRVFCHGVGAAPDGPFATVNFVEFYFFSHALECIKGQRCVKLRSLSSCLVAKVLIKERRYGYLTL